MHMTCGSCGIIVIVHSERLGSMGEYFASVSLTGWPGPGLEMVSWWEVEASTVEIAKGSVIRIGDRKHSCFPMWPYREMKIMRRLSCAVVSWRGLGVN